MRSITAPVVLLALAACNGGKDDTAGGSPTNPTGTGPTPPTTTTPGTTYEQGCILVDGGGGYAYLADALEVADDGSIITLCDGVLQEAVTVLAKSVVIQGRGTAASEWAGPTNEIPITVGAGGSAEVTDISITSTRSGALVDGGQLTLTTVDITEVGTYGVEVRGGDLVATELSIIDAPWGGVFVTDGTIDIDSATIRGSAVAGIWMEGDSMGSVGHSTISETSYTDDGSGYIFDGAGIQVTTDSTVTTNGNTYHNNVLAGVFADGGTAELNGDIVTSDADFVQYLGLFAVEGEMSATGTSVETAWQYGVFAATATVTLENTDIVGDPEASLPSSIDGLGNISLGSIGILAVDTTLTMRGGLISGWNSAGAFGESSQTTVAMSFDGTVLDGNWERGMYVYGGSIDAVDTTIRNTYRNDPVCVDETSNTVACNMAMFAIDSDVTYTGGRVADNPSWGLAALLTTLQIDGTTFTNNEEVGAFGQESVVTVTNATFDGGRSVGLMLNTATGLVQDTVFRNAAYDYTYYGWDGTKTSYYTYYLSAWDIHAYSSDLAIDGATFENGENGVYVSSASTLEMTGSSFEGMAVNGVYSYDSAITVEDVVANDSATDTFYCYLGSMDISDTTVTDAIGYRYKYAYFYGDGTYAFGADATSAAQVIDGSDCDLTLDDVEIVRPIAEGVSCTDCSVEVDGLSVRGGGTDPYTDAGLDLTWYDVAPDAELTDIEVTGLTNGAGIELVDYSGLTGFTTITGVSLGQSSPEGYGLPKYGIYADGIEFTLQGVDIADTSWSAMRILNASSATITGAGGTSLGEIRAAGQHAIETDSSSVTLADLTLIQPGSAGMRFTSGTHTIGGVTVDQAGTYGMECIGVVTFTSCDATLDGALGASSGCPECTSGGDTGI